MLALAEILRRYWTDYVQCHGAGKIPLSHHVAVQAILSCHTAECGASLYGCRRCGRQHFAYHRCGHRACPACGQAESELWTEKQSQKLVRAPCFLVTFTVPEELRAVVRSNQRLFYDLLFRISAQTLQETGGQRKHLNGMLGMLGVLHTWSRQLIYHPHIHYLIPGVGLRGAECSVVKSPEFLLPVRVLGARFRIELKRALEDEAPHLLSRIPAGVWLKRKKWVVHCQPAGSGEPALRYLARYIRKTAISQERILRQEDGKIVFSYRESNSGKSTTAKLVPEEFIRRFLQHVLPKSFRRVRTYGWLSPAASRRFGRISLLVNQDPKPEPAAKLKKTKVSFCCSNCKYAMHLLGRITRKGDWIRVDSS